MTVPSPSLFPGPDVFPGPELTPESPIVAPRVPAEVPHFAYPFRFDAAGAVTTEQDSGDEIMDCARVVLLCPRGYRAELPDFGIPDQTFRNEPDVQAIESALAEWEPRAIAHVTANRDATDELVSNVTARLSPRAQD
jgi:phage baseplate assembly protein W